jgi:hypothetical protein
MEKRRGPLVALGSALLALLQNSGSPAPGVPEVMAQPTRRDGTEDGDPLLLVPPRMEQPSLLLAHRSHSSHSSHRSHSSGGYVGGPSGETGAPAVQAPAVQAPEPPPPPPKPGRVTLVAYPGGKIFVDGKLVGNDSTTVLTLQPGRHEVRVENRFVGDTNQSITVDDGQTGIIVVQW